MAHARSIDSVCLEKARRTRNRRRRSKYVVGGKQAKYSKARQGGKAKEGIYVSVAVCPSLRLAALVFGLLDSSALESHRQPL